MEYEAFLAIAVAGALAGLLTAAALREAALAWPAVARWCATALEPLARAGREGREPTSVERRRLAVLGAVALLVAGWLVGGLVVALVLSLAGPAAAGWAVSRRRHRYCRTVERALPGLAVAIADALASGRSARGAIVAASGSMEGPIGAELAMVRADLELGAPTALALESLRARVRSERVDRFVAALIAPRLAGGELALLLRRYATSAADRDRLGEEVRSATAQARFTGLLVVAMPAGASLFAELVEPGFILALVRSPAAAALVSTALGLQLVGFWAIRRLSASQV